MAWYGAVDFSALEERDWRLDTSLQGGLVSRSGGHAYRLFVQWYDGRVMLGQFTMFSEAALSLGATTQGTCYSASPPRRIPQRSVVFTAARCEEPPIRAGRQAPR